MKRSFCIAAGLLGIAMLIGCAAQARNGEPAPDTEKIQIVGQIETPVPTNGANSEKREEPAVVSEAFAVTEAPTPEPTEAPTPEPTEAQTAEPTEAPTPEPTEAPDEGQTGEASSASQAYGSKAEQFCEVAKSFLNKAYRRGGKKPETGFDPGGFVYYCLNEVGVDVRHKTSKGYSENNSWTKVNSIGDLEPGDLCFFMTPGNESVNCVSIYLGDGQMIYPSSGEGKVIVNKITSKYWKEAFVFARRVF